MCQGHVDISQVERKFGIDFDDHFALELASLKTLETDGIVEMSERSIDVTANGLLLLRIIAMKFDEYLKKDIRGKAYSKVI